MQLKKHWLIIILIVFTGCTTQDATSVLPTQTAQNIYMVGQTASVDNINVLVSKTYYAQEYSGTKPSDAGKRFMVVEMDFTNKSEHESDVDSSSDMYLIDDTGTGYPAYHISDGTSSLNIELEEDSVNVGNVAFEIPESAKIQYFEFKPQWSKNTTIKYQINIQG
jgi:hypothetical protein